MTTVFPLPLSSNFKLFNYKFPSGPFIDCRILWPAQFVKQDSVVGPEHVFILKNEKNEFHHCLWRWNSREPEYLLEKHWTSCFQQELHTSACNRYLFCAHSLQLMLPYVPHTLHKKWTNSKLELRDDAAVVSKFQKYFDLSVFNENKKRYDRFAGWQKKHLKKSINEYVKYVAKNSNNLEVPINFGVKIENLKPEKKLILDQACAILHSLFPNFCTEVLEE